MSVVSSVRRAVPGVLRAWDALLNGVGLLTAILAAVLTLALVYEVVARYLLNRPTNWAVDLIEYGLVYITFLGSAWVLRLGGHVSVDTLVVRLNPRAQLFLHGVASLVIAGVMVVFVWKGTELTWEAYARGDVMVRSWLVPVWPVRLPIPIGCLLMLLEALRQAGESFAAWRVWVPSDAQVSEVATGVGQRVV